MTLQRWPRFLPQIIIAVFFISHGGTIAYADADPADELGLANADKSVQDPLHTPPAPAPEKPAPPALTFDDPGYQRLLQYIPPLRYDRNGRWPLLLWANETQSPDQLQAWIDRGISPLFNYNIEKHIDVWKQLQDQHVPVIFMMQGHTQRLFRFNKRSNSKVNHDDHIAPAEGDCPAYLLTHPDLRVEGDRMSKLCTQLRDAGVTVDAVFLDFESGTFLRNGAEGEPNVRKAMTEAMKCSRCVEQFGKEKLADIHAFRALCDAARAKTTRITASDPFHQVFPKADIGNFFAWPIERYINQRGELDPTAYDTRGGAFPAYGYTDSGMNIMQPRCYYVPGWQDWGLPEAVTVQRTEDWNVFTYTIRRVSLAARVLRPGEKLVPWVGWLWSASRNNTPDRQLKVASSAGYRETIIHILLRGAETVAVFDAAPLDKNFDDDYNADRRELGPLLHNLVDVQAAYDQILRFQPFLATAKPLNLHHDGVANQSGTAWSGYGNEKAALIRTVSFRENLELPVMLYGRAVTLPFHSEGRWFWVFPDGTYQPVE